VQKRKPSGQFIVIAIDGPAGAGKSTTAKLLAQRLDFFLLDTGALYRVMALHLERLGVSPDAEEVAAHALESLDLRIEPHIAGMKLFLGGEDVSQIIREEKTGNLASRFSAKPEVRRALLGLQRSLGERMNLVAEGRDMGTVVFPVAALKFFVTADLAQRAERRYAELLRREQKANLSEVLAEMRARDDRDESRAESPLVQAPDAIVVDTTSLSPHQVLEIMMNHIGVRLDTRIGRLH
jgi:cytidylate kinase